MVVLPAAAAAPPAPLPAELTALLARTRVAEKVTAWCGGEFASGRARAYAIAAAAPSGGGSYLVLGLGEHPVRLATFRGGADLACYSPAEAKALDKSIRESDTIHGGVASRWRTTVVCGFVENTRAVCWQYSPVARAFVKVGEWITWETGPSMPGTRNA